MDKQRFYKRELRCSTKYIQVLHDIDDTTTEVLLVDLDSTADYLSDYKLSWVAPKWDRWTVISKQDFFAAVAKYAAIDALMSQATKRDTALPLEPKTRGRSKLFKT